MADWKQITARIRRARTGKDPVGQLSSLFEKTRDAMVAFELARVLETSGQNSDAAKWYVAAAERFRRADWKSKAQEAAVRLGADISAAASAAAATDGEPESTALEAEDPALATSVSEAPEAESAPSTQVSEEAAAPSGTDAETKDRGRRRRGRRGGRNRRRGEPRESVTAVAPPASVRTHTEESTSTAGAEAGTQGPRAGRRHSAPAIPVEPLPDSAAATVRGRSGDPGLSSRLSALEMQLRRLLSCPPVKLSDADHAPAGPGVLLLTDSDLTSYYYVEPCQTLRIAVGNLLRGSTSRRGAEAIKPRLAEHLGIPETRVAKYLTDHCVVRWLQLDDGASHFAHFAVAVLRPTLNE
jgi:hypothetical protein